MCVSDRENLFCLDRVGVEEADGPVDGHECQRQYRVVDKGEPKHFQTLILAFKTNYHITPLASVQTLLFLLPHMVSSEASFKTCQNVETKLPVVEALQCLQLNLLIHGNKIFVSNLESKVKGKNAFYK